MVLPLVLLALQAPAASPVVASPADQRPVRIWMDAQGPVNRGKAVRLYVQAAAAGNLVVLHYRTDGRIEVLFPVRPSDDPRVSAGTYEVRGANDAPIWVVAEPDGTGMILAALSSDPIWFDEFSRDADWRPDALHASWDGADAPSALTDVVQRMLGDGAFNYDVLSYTVAPQAIAQAPDSATPSDQQASCGDCGVEYRFFVSAQAFRGGRRFGGGEPLATHLPTPAVAAPLVLPIRSLTTPPASRPVAVMPRHRSDAPAQPLVPRRAATGFGGAPPETRSAVTLRFVRTRGAGTPSPEIGHPDVEARGGGVGAQHAAPPQIGTTPLRIGTAALRLGTASLRLGTAPAGEGAEHTAPLRMTMRGGGVGAQRAAPLPFAHAAPRQTRGTWSVGGGRHR